jgi:rRNA maturation protein Rpf1
MGNVAKRRIVMDESVLNGTVAILQPLKEEEFSDRDFAINESMIIYIEEHNQAPSPIELMDMMQTDKLSDVYLELEHLQEIGVIGYAPKMPNPIVIVRGM